MQRVTRLAQYPGLSSNIRDIQDALGPDLFSRLLLKKAVYEYDVSISRIVFQASTTDAYLDSPLASLIVEIVAEAGSARFSRYDELGPLVALVDGELAAGLPWKIEELEATVVVGPTFKQQTNRTGRRGTWRMDAQLTLWHEEARHALVAYNPSMQFAVMSPTEFLPLVSPPGSSSPRLLQFDHWTALDAPGERNCLRWTGRSEPTETVIIGLASVSAGRLPDRFFLERDGGRRVLVGVEYVEGAPEAWPIASGKRVVIDQKNAGIRIDASAWVFFDAECKEERSVFLQVAPETRVFDARTEGVIVPLGSRAEDWPSEVRSRVLVGAVEKLPSANGSAVSAAIGLCCIASSLGVFLWARCMRKKPAPRLGSG
jgi:hypothetical protein